MSAGKPSLNALRPATCLQAVAPTGISRRDSLPPLNAMPVVQVPQAEQRVLGKRTGAALGNEAKVTSPRPIQMSSGAGVHCPDQAIRRSAASRTASASCILSFCSRAQRTTSSRLENRSSNILLPLCVICMRTFSRMVFSVSCAASMQRCLCLSSMSRFFCWSL